MNVANCLELLPSHGNDRSKLMLQCMTAPTTLPAACANLNGHQETERITVAAAGKLEHQESPDRFECHYWQEGGEPIRHGSE